MSKFLCLPKEWREVTVGTVADVIDPHPSHRAPNEDPLGIPFAGIGDLDEYGRVREDKVRKVSHEIFEEHIKRYKITDNSIGFGRVASLGKIIDFKVFKRKVTISPTMAIVEPRGGMSKSFLVHCLRSQETEGQINFFLTGSTRSSLGIALLRNLLVPEPPLPEQKKIVAILSSVDEVIEKTRAQIDKLKDLKTGMMQELLTKGIGPGGVPHTEFKDSPVGQIPVGWNVVLMDCICKKITDGEHQTPKRSAYGYYLLSARNIRDGYIALDNVDFIDTSEYQRISKRIEPQEGDILISCSGSIGRTAIVPKKLKFSMVRSVAILQPKRDLVDSQYLAHQISSPLIQTQIEKSLSQLAQANLFQAPIKALNVVLPPMTEQLKIAQVVNSLVEVINEKTMNLNRTNSLKKALMQDLLTGKVRVNVEARELAEA